MKYPTGFCHVVTANGQDGGFGFYCERCHFQINANAPKKVSHCGRVDEFKPGLFQKVPTVQLAYGRERLLAALMIEI